jgi:undecaprenyl diphosphate synthase
MLRRGVQSWAKPRHAAFILDGNRRFALQAKLPACRMGHERGAARFLELIAHCHRYGINNLSVYALSIENFSRSEKEIAAILDIVRSTCDDMLDPASIVNRLGCRLRVIGDRRLVPDDVRRSIARAEEHTRNHTAMTLFMSVAYDGREEIVRAARRCVADQGKVGRGITIADLAREMYLRAHGVDVPPVDFVVRTGGARRLSSFLMWDSSHAEIYFDDTLWPDFGEYHFLRALAAFNQRIESSQASDLQYWGDASASPAYV